MDDFLSYLTDERIVKMVCKEINKYIFANPKNPVPEHVRQLKHLLPPSFLWVDLTYEKRTNKDEKIKAMQRLRHILLRHIERDASYPYVARLRTFMDSLRTIAADPLSYTFPPMVVKAQIKKEKAEYTVCRPTCVYHNLTAKILTALMADYFKTWLDPLLHETNMAYRPPREWKGNPKVVTSNDHAIDWLMCWRAAHDDQSIYIAECDIQKFFDTIDHEDAIAALHEMMRRAGKVDTRFAVLYERFIRSFDFQRDVMSCNDDPEYWRSQFGDKAEGHVYRFEWIKNAPAKPIGVPQGVALSPPIANMLLNIIDEQTLGERMVNGHIVDDQLLYMRYSDDILIAHTSLTECTQVIEAYCDTLTRHHLAYHPLDSVSSMKDGRKLHKDDKNQYLFWEAKSKKPYLWGDGPGDASQWIGYLGYEISRDGKIRLRKSSIAAVAEKIYKQALRIRFYDQHRQAQIDKFAQDKIGGGRIDTITHIVSQELYDQQRAKLAKLKARKLRKLQTVSAG